MPHITLARIAARFPLIPWTEPIAMSLPEVRGYACRICLALYGLKGTDSARVLPSEDAVRAHITATHTKENTQ